MKFRKLLSLAAVLLASLTVSACGGADGTAGNGNTDVSVSLRGISAPLTDETGEIGLGYKISRIFLDVYAQGDHNPNVRINILNRIKNGDSEVIIDGLEAGREYVFSVSAYGVRDLMLCSGSDTATITANQDTEINLTCKFDNETTLRASLYEIADFFINDNDRTPEKIEAFIADNATFGIENGLDRAAFIQDALDDDGEFIPAPLEDVEIADIQPAAYGKILKIKIKYEDGSYEFHTLRVVKQNGVWKYAGNGFLYELDIAPRTLTAYYPDNHTETYSGIYADVYDMTGNISYITVTGPKLPAAGTKMIRSTYGGDNFIFQAADNGTAGSGMRLFDKAVYPIDDDNITGIADNAAYTFKAYDSNGTLLETRTLNLPVRPFTSTEVTEGHFLKPITAISGIVTDYKTTDFTATLSKPAAEHPVFMRATFEAGDNYAMHNFFEKALPVNTSLHSLTFSTSSVSFTPFSGSFTAKAVFENGRETLYVRSMTH
ncbi:nuclear transport factor 2 family protein [Geovibrio thiophilus]|uniref:Nuclear transport factor 2 family protein n=1 Tax=Geovibrio thiophilus TaxID=139438 RepID=A0A3R5XWM1_9BACT|nr:nuclear transport factor 2 family protein [Geovibrio thiophilus]QAR32964.1 nuclear transport factor 2 family protein [Geovibrio thiophilus]